MVASVRSQVLSLYKYLLREIDHLPPMSREYYYRFTRQVTTNPLLAALSNVQALSKLWTHLRGGGGFCFHQNFNSHRDEVEKGA